MANFFPRWTNWLAFKLTICVGVIVLTLVAGIWYYFTPKYTRVGYQPTQPVQFSHVIHAQQLEMDCRYCHSFVEVASHSNVPNTQTCINCHGVGKIQATSPKLEPIRTSWETGEPVDWVRIHQVPDYAYFNHAVHVNRGVSCVSCHGKINEMPVVYHAEPLSMGWCLECHRNPENFLRPVDEVTNLDWTPPAGETQQEIGLKLKEEWAVQPPETCGGCHR